MTSDLWVTDAVSDETRRSRFEDKVAHTVLSIGDTTVLASDGRGENQPEFSGFSLSLTVSDDGGGAIVRGSVRRGDCAGANGPTPFASRLGLVADKFGVPWMVVSQNATG